MDIFYYGRVADAAGAAKVSVAPPRDVRTVEALCAFLARGNPGLREALLHPSVRIAVNDEIIVGDGPVSPGDEIAFMPPVSGG